MTNTCGQSRRVNLLPWDRLVYARTQQIESAGVTCSGQWQQRAPFPVWGPSAGCVDTRVVPESTACPMNNNTLLGLPTGVDPIYAHVISSIAFCVKVLWQYTRLLGGGLAFGSLILIPCWWWWSQGACSFLALFSFIQGTFHLCNTPGLTPFQKRRHDPSTWSNEEFLPSCRGPATQTKHRFFALPLPALGFRGQAPYMCPGGKRW